MKNAAASTMAIITNAGYSPPKDVNALTTMSKARAVGALKGVVIDQIDSLGNSLEKWTLNNAFITSANLGDLAYDDDGLSEITLSFRYDWATCEVPKIPTMDHNLPAGIPGGVIKSNSFFKLGS